MGRDLDGGTRGNGQRRKFLEPQRVKWTCSVRTSGGGRSSASHPCSGSRPGTPPPGLRTIHHPDDASSEPCGPARRRFSLPCNNVDVVSASTLQKGKLRPQAARRPCVSRPCTESLCSQHPNGHSIHVQSNGQYCCGLTAASQQHWGHGRPLLRAASHTSTSH